MPASPASRQAALYSSPLPASPRRCRLLFCLLPAAVVLLLAGCWVDVEVEVNIDGDGSGRVTTNVVFSQELTDTLLTRWASSGTIGIDFADFEANGWEVSPDSESAQRDGQIVQVLTLTKPFVSPEHLKTILEDELRLGLVDVSLAREVRGDSVYYQLRGRFEQELLSFNGNAGAAGLGEVDNLARAPRVTLTVNMPDGEQTSTLLGSSNTTGNASFEFAASTRDSGPRIWQWVGWAAAALFVFVILMNLLGYLIERRQRRAEASDDSATAEETTVDSANPLLQESSVSQLNSINLPSGTPAVSCVVEGSERALVIIPDIMGLRPLFEEHTLRLARENNWSVCCYELYAENSDYELEERFDHASELEDDRVLGDAIAAADALTEGTDIPVGIIGFCMGGMYVNKSIAAERFDRAVSFYGMIEVPEAWKSDTQREPLECIAEGDASKLLAVIAEDDDYTPVDEVASLREAGAKIVSYASCDHGFAHDPNREAHRPDEAADAWEVAIAFLKGDL